MTGRAYEWSGKYRLMGTELAWRNPGVPQRSEGNPGVRGARFCFLWGLLLQRRLSLRGGTHGFVCDDSMVPPGSVAQNLSAIATSPKHENRPPSSEAAARSASSDRHGLDSVIRRSRPYRCKSMSVRLIQMRQRITLLELPILLRMPNESGVFLKLKINSERNEGGNCLYGIGEDEEVVVE